MKGIPVTPGNVWKDCKVIPNKDIFPKRLYYTLLNRGMSYGIINLNKISEGAEIEVNWYMENHTFIQKFWCRLDESLLHDSEGNWDIDEMMSQLDVIGNRL